MQRRAGHVELAERDARVVLERSPDTALGVRARLELADDGKGQYVGEAQAVLARHRELPAALLEETLWCSGRVANHASQWDAAWTALASACRLAAQRGDWQMVGRVELELAKTEEGLNLRREGLDLQVQAQRDFRRAGDPYGEALALKAQTWNHLVDLASSPELPRQQTRRFREATPRFKDPRLALWARVYQARALLRAEGPERARRYLEADIAAAARRGDHLEEALASRQRAYLSELDSNYTETWTWHQRALRLGAPLEIHPKNPLFGTLNRVDLEAEQANYDDFIGRPLEALQGYRRALKLAVERDQQPDDQLIFQLLRTELAANDNGVLETWQQIQRWIDQSTDPARRAELYDLALFAVHANTESTGDDVGFFKDFQLADGSLAKRFLHQVLAEPALAAFRKAREGSGTKTRMWLAEGLADHLLGRYTEATSAYRLAMESAVAGDQPGYVFMIAWDLAMELERQGRSDDARDCLLAALPKALPPLGPPRVRMFLADWYRIHGQPAEAVRVADDFLPTRKSHQYDDVASVLRIKADALAAMGRPQEALALLSEVGQELRTRKESYELALVLAQTARVQWSLHHPDLALAAWDESLQRFPTTVGLFMPARLALQPMRVLQASDPARAARIGEACLGRVLDDPAHLYRPPVPGSAAERPVREVLDLTMSCLLASHQSERASALMESVRAWQTRPEVDLSHAGPAAAAVQARRQELRLLSTSAHGGERRDQARQELLAALNTLRQQNPELESLLPTSSPELARVQEHLPADTLLLQLYPGEEELFVLAQRSSGLKVYPVPVPRSLLRQKVAAWRAALTNPAVPPPEDLRRQLVSWLLQPVEGLDQAKRVLVLPTDCLWYLPWDSLEAPGRHDWCELTSPDLAVLESAPSRARGLSLVLGPSPDADLPAASQEARDIAGLMPSTKLLEGAASSRAQLEQLSPGASILHFCTHGRVESGDLNESLLRLADGPLSLQDVYGLHLPRGAMVVLSACSTGLGEATPGRSVTSLASAFRAAGASTVLSTLWPVEDEPTRKLMLAFYGGVKRGLSRGEALQQAKLQLSREPGMLHPFYWAGFNLSGDPR